MSKDNANAVTVTYTADELDFVNTRAAKKNQNPVDYIHEASLNRGKNRYRDKQMKTMIVDTIADLNSYEGYITDGKVDKQAVLLLDNVREDLRKLCQY